MHILLIHQAFAALDEPGGTRHHELARYLAAQGHRVTVIASPISYLTGKNSRPETEEAGIRILRPYVYPHWHRSFFHRLLSFFSFTLSSFLAGLGVQSVDLVWGTSPPIFQGVSAWALARLKRRRFLFEVRDLWPAFAVAVGVLHNPLLIRASEWLEAFLYRRADTVVVNSPGFLEHVRSRGARRVELVPNGADTRMFDPQDEGLAFRRAHGLEGKFVALYAGAHGLSNDLDVVLEAARQVQDNPRLVLVLLGDGKEKARLQRRAAEMGLENVRFIASIPKTEMPAALAAADACIAILKPVEMYKTVYPNKVFDYMAAGRAVILAIEGVIREVVEAAEGGLTIPPGDAAALAEAIRRLEADPALRRRLGQNGRAFVAAHFDRAALAARMEEVMRTTQEPAAPHRR